MSAAWSLLQGFLVHRPSRRELALRRSLQETSAAFDRCYDRARKAETELQAVKAARDTELRTYLDGKARAETYIEHLGGRLDEARVAIGEYRGVVARLTDPDASWGEYETAKQDARNLIRRPDADWGIPA